MYLTYQEYQDYGFTDVIEFEFDRYSKEAQQFLRYYTQKRTDIAIVGDYSDDIKQLMCLLVEVFKSRRTALNALEQGLDLSRKGIASESVTDHSVSFSQKSESSKQETDDQFKKEAIALIREHLLWTGLLYRGL